MEYQPNRRFLAEYRRSSPELRAVLQSKVDNAADYWAARTRKRTGKLAENTYSAVIDGPQGLEGLFEANPFYAGFQERGTEDVEAMYLIPEIMTLLESGDL